MEAMSPMLLVAYLAAQWHTARVAAKTTEKRSRGDVGEVTRDSRSLRRLEAGLVGGEFHTPLQDKSESRIIPYRGLQPSLRQKIWKDRSKLIRESLNDSVENSNPEKLLANLPGGVSVWDWYGTGRFPSFDPLRRKSTVRFMPDRGPAESRLATVSRPDRFEGSI